MMCQAVKVSPSGYYAWCTRPESCRRRYDRELTQAIRLLHAESGGTYGSPTSLTSGRTKAGCT
jgi:putative transposase